MEGRLRNAASVNKRLYKLLLLILKIIPFLLSINDEKHFALYIKDTIDDEDAGDGTTMRRWYATMVANGMMVDWEDVI